MTELGEGESLHQHPHALPGGRHVLFSVHSQSRGGELAVADLRDGTHRLLGLEGSQPRLFSSTTLLFANGDSVFSAPFDQSQHEVTGPPVSILPDALVGDFGGELGMGLFLTPLDVDSKGDIAYLARSGSQARRLAWIDQAGRLNPIGIREDRYSSVRLSPDGSRILAGLARDRIQVIDVARGLPLELDGRGLDPIWSPDGAITVGVPRAFSIQKLPLDGTLGPEEILRGSQGQMRPEDWSPDGRILYSFEPEGSRGANNRDLQVAIPGGDPRSLLDSPADETNGRISPNGEWLAYQSTGSGGSRVYLRPFDRSGGTQTLSAEGGHHPVWARDGSALFFLQGGSMMKASVEYGPFRVGVAEALFDLPMPSESFDVSPDGRFLMILDAREAREDEFRVILGWTP